MNSLSIHSIINPEQDSELTTYKILGTLKDYLTNIRKYRIYPALSELVGLAVRLENLKKSIAKPKSSDDDLFILDEEASAIENLKSAENNSNETDDCYNFIDWVIAQINPILDEGIAVYDFVDQNMDLEIINGNPHNNEEGYLVIPDNITSVLNIYRFNRLLFKKENYQERSLKTEFIQSIPSNDSNGIRIQYSTLLEYFADNTSPVYICETELDFPYEETIYQIAKKKLLNILSS